MTELPASLIKPVKLSAETPDGVFFSYKSSDPAMLAFRWDGVPHVLRLTGQYAFSCFPVKPGKSVRGILVGGAEFRVDTSSRYDALQKSDPLGALVFQGGKIFVVGWKVEDNFGDPLDVPLWGDYESDFADEKVDFAKWESSCAMAIRSCHCFLMKAKFRSS